MRVFLAVACVCAVLFAAMAAEDPICRLLKKQGSCEAIMPRWYYDYHTKSCQQFIYGGCRGNTNKLDDDPVDYFIPAQFHVFADPKSICHLPKLVGLCKAAMPRWHWDNSSKSCKKFIYGGCRGNANNFETQECCEKACKKKC